MILTLASGFLIQSLLAPPPGVTTEEYLAKLIRFASAKGPSERQLATADAIVEAKVIGIDKPHSVAAVAGDWLWTFTGHRFGIPEPATLEIRLEDVVVLRGAIPPNHVLVVRQGGSVVDGPRRPIVGHKYAFFCTGAPAARRVSWLTDLAAWPPDV